MVARPAAVRPTSILPVPTEMPLPALATRIKERSNLPCQRVDSRKVRTLVAVVKKTSQGEVVATTRACVAFSDDVVDFKRNRVLLLQQLTVLATGPCPFPDLLNDAALHAFTNGIRVRFP